MKNTYTRKTISLVMALMLMLSAMTPAVFANAEGGIVEVYEIEICDKDGVIIPDKDESGEDYVLSVMESEKVQLSYDLKGSNIPEGGYVKWYSETPTLVDVDDTGLVTAFDSSKGAVVQLWIDNEVKTVPLIGGIMGSMLESALFNDTVNVDTMDTDQIISIIERLFGENSTYGSYTSGFVSSLKEYLKKLNCGIHAQVCDSNGNVLAQDVVKVLVTKSDKWYANFLPNGTHITNKESINTTVAVGSTVKLEALTTPKRLNYGVTYTIQNTSLFNQGGDIAEVDENGNVTFKKTGTVTVVASPKSEDVTKGLRDFMKTANSLIANGNLNTDQIADILINTMGVNMNKTVLKALLDGYVRVAQFSDQNSGIGDAAANAISSIADNIMKYVYRDSITFTVVEPVPLEDFSISGPASVQEGAQIQLVISDVVPSTGDVSEITWSSSNPSIASVDPKTGTVTGRDAGGSLGALSSKSCQITATSSSNNISKSVTVKVTGRTGTVLSDAKINGPVEVAVGEDVNYTYSVYPDRHSDSQYLSVSWGIVTGTDSETGEPTYTWADKNNDVSDGIGSISSDGTYSAVRGGLCTIALKAVTGYTLLGNYTEMSRIITTLDVQNDIPVTGITLSAENAGFLGNNNIGTLTVEEKELGGEKAYFATVKINAITPYYGRGVKAIANIEPDAATNADVVWHISNPDEFYTENEKDNTIEVRARATSLNSVSTQIWCETADGRIKSPIMTLTVTRNVAVDNKINGGDIETAVDKDVNVTHTVSYDGNNTGNTNANHEALWTSSDESIFTVTGLDDRTGNAIITGVDVGVATVYCTSADGGITDSKKVTVYPNKDYLLNVTELCNKTVIRKTEENKKLYSDYMEKLDKAYYVLYDVPMAAQSVCDTTADRLLGAFVKLGGYVGVGNIVILNSDENEIENKNVSVDVGTLANYTNSSYQFNYKVIPENSMYSRVEWKSDSSKVKVDKNGKCTPASNGACSALITCTIRDYLGNEISDSAYISFAKTPVTGVTLNKNSIMGGEIGETEQLKATIQPTGVINIGDADVKDVIWTSSDSSVASVDSDGTVHFNKGGDCVITVKTVDGGYTAQCSVNVVTNYSTLSALVSSYDSQNLKAEDYYPNTFNPFTEKLGEAKQMLQERTASQDEVDAMCEALTSAYASLKKYTALDRIEIYLDGEPASEYYQYDLGLISSYSNAKLNLNVRLYPNNGGHESVTWESSTSFIKVTSDGVCSPTSNNSGYGKITCTVTDHFGRTFSDFVWVSFAKTPVTGIDISDTVVDGKPGQTKQLSATVKPEGGILGIGKADIQDVYWSSDNEAVATVDSNGLVTFKSAGVANIKVTAFDGGFSKTCVATTLGDRTALAAALEQYKDIQFSDYEYDHGIAFKEAYSAAQSAMTDTSLSQDEIDTAATNLLEAATDLYAHPFVRIENINLDWTASDLRSVKKSGTVGNNNSIQIVSSEVATLTTSVKVEITPTVTPENAMYKSIKWNTVSSHNMSLSEKDGKATLSPTAGALLNIDAYAIVEVVFTDHYDRTYSRQVSVVVGRAFVNGITINTPDYTTKATDAPATINYTLSSSNGNTNNLNNKEVIWSSSDDSIASVENGVVTPHEEGTAVITAKTVDGGYTDSVTVTVTPDYDTLYNAVREYTALISESRGKYIYTEESLDVLETAVNDARPIAEERTAKQSVVNAKYDAVMSAYNALERYVKAEGLTLGVNEGEDSAEVVNPGYIRYTSTSLNGKSFKLRVNTIPAGSRYEQVEFTSDNSAVTVSADGTVKSNNSTSKVAKISCKITNYDNTSYTYDAYVSFVRYGVTGISFNSEEQYFGYNGETAQLSPEITYTESSSVSSYYVSQCRYVSSDESIATVNQNGVVTFVSFGKATITATTLDGGYTASVDVYTTNDTRQLRETLSLARGFTYTDYAYDYGMPFKNKYDAALSVYNNPASSQEAIDAAESELNTAMLNLNGHPFIAPSPKIVSMGNEISDNATLETDANSKITFGAEFAIGGMVKSYTMSASNLKNVRSTKNSDGSITLTRTAETGSATVTLNVNDDYGRTETVEINVKLVEKLIPCTGVSFTANGESIGSSYTYSCGGSYSNIDLTVGYVPIPANSNMIESVSYSSSSNTVKIDSETGKVTMNGWLLLSGSYSATITCTVKNSDKSTAKSTLSLTVKRN